MTTAAAAPQEASAGKTRERLIDVDVHPSPAGRIKDLFPYMTKEWVRRIGYLGETPLANAPSGRRAIHPRGHHRENLDAIPPEGGKAASSPSFLISDFVDRYDIDNVLLIAHQAADVAVASTSHDYSAAFVSAFNQMMFDEWLIDPRLRYALNISPHDPEAAAAEIRIHGGHPGVAGVFVPLLNTRLGSKRWYPIYEAAVDMGLPIVTHGGTGEGAWDGAPTYAVGVPELFTERNVDLVHIGAATVTSLIFQGVFTRFPSLKVMLVEFGSAWMVPHMWRMDKAWRELRTEVPWLTKWPSEYIQEHITVSSQPIPEPRRGEDFTNMVEDYLADVLCYSSDYPHWDGDRPGQVLRKLSEPVKRKVMFENAQRVLRLS
jgi:predicted TIM-barrel fold metal-dependent hydrolase